MGMRISKYQRMVIKGIGTGTSILDSFTLTNLLKLLKPKSSQQKYHQKKIFNKLFDDKIIYLFGDEVRLTEKGIEILKLMQIEDVQIGKFDDWDGIWHLVCYDIPEKFKKERDFFRSKLIKAGFKVIQDSLWVYPYECKEEIAIIAQSLGISPFVAYLNTDYLPGQNNILRYFHLSAKA